MYNEEPQGSFFVISDMEKDEARRKYDLIVGIDEVGRGAWAGPLYMGAFICEPNQKKFRGIRDSKQLIKKKRENIYKRLCNCEYQLEIISNQQIDEKGLGRALNESLFRLLTRIREKFKNAKIRFLVDGRFSVRDKDIEYIIKGDAKEYSIGAASILAKVERDNLMMSLSQIYTNYSFDTNVGYGTRKHREALAKYGVTEIHRKSYTPIRKLIEY